jgi:hypothetical protein
MANMVMESGNYLLIAVRKGGKYLHLIRPVVDGDLLVLGWLADELENVIVLNAGSSGVTVQLTGPLISSWPDGTPVGVSDPDMTIDF